MNTLRALYDEIGRGYDDSRRADPYIADRLFHLLDAQRDDLVLDVACGTGNYTAALRSRYLKIFGIDLSARMLSAARQKGLGGRIALANVEQLPFSDETFSRALCALATHHFADLLISFKEIMRVVSRGKLVIFTSTPEQMQGYWLNEYFPVAIRDSITQMPTLDVTTTALEQAGFVDITTEIYDVRPDLQDHFLYSGKHAPERYLDDLFRYRISTFSSLADPVEVQEGCLKLSRDIETGNVNNVINSYRHDQGDYLFVIAEIA